METLENGEIVSKQADVKEYVKSLVLPNSIRVSNHKKLYDQKPVLEIKNLKTYYSLQKNIWGKTTSYVKAVDDVSFDVFPGETLGLIGESGCGKTTTGKSIIQLNEIHDGEIFYKGKDVLKMNKEELMLFRREVQIIFQDPYSSLNPRITIGNAIMEPMKVHRILADDVARKKRVIELLKTVNLLPEHFNNYPHQFSGGQRQRVEIARALAMEPKFILLDEPFQR